MLINYILVKFLINIIHTKSRIKICFPTHVFKSRQNVSVVRCSKYLTEKVEHLHVPTPSYICPSTIQKVTTW